MDGATHLDELRLYLSCLMVRRLKLDVLKELPAKRRQIIELPITGLDPDLRARLVAAREHIELIEEYATDVRRLESKIRAAWDDMAQLRHDAGMAKVPMAISLIRDAIAASGQVVVFAYHRDVINWLEHDLAEYFPAIVHGGTPLKTRQWAVDSFQKGGSKVFIGQIQAAGVGITLTAASHVIFLELDWTPGMMSQAEDRCHRIGQTESVLVQHLVLENSLDAHMAKTLVRKQGVAEKLLDGKGLK